jgi:hypothetical protein
VQLQTVEMAVMVETVAVMVETVAVMVETVETEDSLMHPYPKLLFKPTSVVVRAPTPTLQPTTTLVAQAQLQTVAMAAMVERMETAETVAMAERLMDPYLRVLNRPT